MLRHPFTLAVLIGIVSGCICGWFNPVIDGTLVDMGWSFNAARDIVAQRDPYRHEPWTLLVPYPLTAAIIVLPWAIVPGNAGLVLLFSLISGFLAYGLIRDGQYWRLMVFTTPTFFMAIKSMQWSPLFMLVLLYPVLAPVLLAKPTLGLPVALSIKWTGWHVVGGLFIGGISLLVMPDWPIRWVRQLTGYGGFIPLLTFIGPIFIISLWFWRFWNARFFFLMTIVPQQYFFYDQLLLWMIPQTKHQMLLLTFSSWAAFYYVRLTFTTLWPSGPYIMAMIYLPTFLILLWQRGVFQPLLILLCQQDIFQRMHQRLPTFIQRKQHRTADSTHD
ncbi:MAG: hypothetical protein GFH27_549325n37 [Chloroflexi bacterium AL-W]|nr:hypothetical protein [Chloroflexi bacterium AL-N1]NOK70113.1 hypothetical protein [Chloroflexi bacterium AL-N10]NOK77875.1 hypothetical protein [Chloroflexi bacterium AL-N5]NOK84884.1 hypothetical protein [Chloroflexi bacterium AL-W]NOK91863.1 hypothetical protein [Chloroflexi bacterium AL-N15]